MKRTETEKLGLQLWDLANFEGEITHINSKPAESYVTRVDMILPIQPGVIPDRLYESEFQGARHEIRIFTVQRIEDDPLFEACKGIEVGLPSGIEQLLPFRGYSDNRDKYPAVLAQVLFPYRIATWTDPEHPTGINLKQDRERSQVTGGPRNEEKIAALIQINRLIKSLQVEEIKSVAYKDVTVFVETYFEKGSTQPLVRKANILSGPNAYRDAVYDFYLPKLQSSGTSKVITQLQKQHAETPIGSEADLKSAVDNVIQNVLKHQIETRRWIEPFWDEDREFRNNGKVVKILKTPKKELKIQPTLQFIFDLALTPLGVHVIRESNEGAGSIDFRFLFTNAEGSPVSTCAEFKLAHRKRLKHGIRNQLPTYMHATKTKSGTYIVMWFKDSKIFNEPASRGKPEVEDWIKQEASLVSKSEEITVTAILIDASIRPSASVV